MTNNLRLSSIFGLNSSKSNKRMEVLTRDFSSYSSMKSRQLSSWAVMFLLILPCFGGGIIEPLPMGVFSLGKRAFLNVGCKGTYDSSLYARLDRICDDCYNLYHAPQIYDLCRWKCFTTEWFEGCVTSLQERDQLEHFKHAILVLHGGAPGDK